MEQPVFALRYLTRFQCLVDRCEDTCCTGMQILISDENQRTLAQAMAGSDAEQSELREKVQALTAEVFGYRWLLQRDEHKTCLFLTPGKLCSVAVRFGEAVMPDPCALFPRVVSRTPERTEVVASLACPEAARLCLLSEDGDERVAWPGADLRQPALLRTEGGAYDTCRDDVRDVLLALLRNRPFSLASRLMQIATLGTHTASFFHRGSAASHEESVQRLRDVSKTVEARSWNATGSSGEPVIQALLSLTTGLQTRGSLRYTQLSEAVLRTYQLGALQLEPRVGQPRAPALWQVLWTVYLKKRDRLETTLGPWLNLYLERYWVNDVYREPYTRAPTLLAHAFQMILRGVVLKFFLVGHPAIEQLAAEREAQTGQTTLSAEQLSVLQRAVVETVQVFAKHLERDRELWELVASHFTPESLGVDALGRAEIFAAAL